MGKFLESKGKSKPGTAAKHTEKWRKQAASEKPGEEILDEELHPDTEAKPSPPASPFEAQENSSPEPAVILEERERSWADASEEIDP